MQGEPEFVLAHFALQKLHILPSTVAKMNYAEKVFLYASIKMRIDDEKIAAAKMKGVK